MKTEESGTRLKVRGTINADESHPAIIWLVKRLCESYGGATVIPGPTGYWVNDDGALLEEVATIVEVSWEPDDAHQTRNAGALDYVRHLFATTQFSVGGEWTHIEVSQFEAAHCHHEHFCCAKVA